MDNQFRTSIRPDINVMGIEVIGVNNSIKAFQQLEKILGDLNNRKFYGILYGDPDNGIYRACTQIKDNDDPKFLNLQSWIIPSGKYTQTTIKDWLTKTDLISILFKQMAAQFQVDETRPYIEYYKRLNELILLLPTQE